MADSSRIFLSPPHMSGAEQAYIRKAFDENYITTAGQNIQDFEKELCQKFSANYAVALNSGTAAIHLALRVLGVGTGDEVLCSTFTFVATANPILYQGATPVFIDSEPDTWNMCPEALEKAIQERLQLGKKPKAILLVHLYGMPAKLDEVMNVANRYDIPVIEDAAEGLGSTYQDKALGTFGAIGIYSFNGNKIITTSGGGALVTDNASLAQKALFLGSQAKDPAPHYQHSEVGYNYRMSNISAGIGLGQLGVLEERVQQRRKIHEFYQQALSPITTIHFLPELPGGFSNRWLSCITLDPDQTITSEKLRQALERENIEARPLWKPLHQQPLFAGNPFYGGSVAENLFNLGLCLPSGSALSPEQLEKITAVILKQFRSA
ncbi:putative pyridoxal phosphate-dependent aminotransferase EpsN [Adhaeribacter aerolatus]|uniref:GDP-perosamine synthase n=1 Tax=Adhaeribacter aerolatus TaxID=670289 RepID=A0A512B4F6_9BACT|nr:aminotransferase class I/II-fold pyridoxal phosphate-dependent enzyme [Adhaeribacter aerolatus]GEO06840.1 putative pyridoxal phosphate-dependent aminotransferase EpsN [Adhaeribacter aerolatus]